MSIKRMSTIFNSSPNSDASGAPATDKEPPTLGQGAPKVLKDLREQIKKGSPLSFNTSTLSAIVDALGHKEAIDDRKLLLEHILAFISKLEDGKVSRALKTKIIQLLYNDLAHPAATSISNKYAWRTADGSYNNIDIPDLGKAGTPYSRSVQQTHPLPQNQLPDPGLLFDTLLRREDFVEHPGGLSSLMFSFAALVIHSVFRTSHRDWNINETSSYVDLAPLYGNSQADQDKIRLRDGRGLLYPDVFAEDRLLLLPPAVCVLLVLFNRNHNYIANKLLEINERGTFVDPATLSTDDPASKAQLVAQEEEIFQTARLVNCGWFGMVVFSDYFSTILGLVRDGSNWSLMPFDEMRNPDHSLFERGRGNVCSVEFNCLYRWHATTSREDEQWTQKVFGDFFAGKSPEQVTVNDFRMAAHKTQQMQRNVKEWTFGEIKRGAGGEFKDADLANILHNATEHSAGAFRARGTPPVMRLNEIMGIEQNRKWGVCSLNDFRKFLGLKPFASFLEWNSDPEIADAAEKLYGDINHLELYVGLQAEEPKPLVDGAGLCPGYTISRAILSDAIALTRGDRYFTHDFTPYNLTAWGFADCQRDPNAFGFGSTLGRLLLRTLPNHFTENSVYTFFPLMTPESMKTILTNLGVIDQYDLSRPVERSPTVSVNGYARVAAILNDKSGGFSAPYKARVTRVLNGPGFFPVEDDKDRQAIVSILSSPDLLEGIGEYFYETTRKLLSESSFKLVGGKVAGVDVVRQVIRFLPVHWVATDLAGIQLKTKDHPHGSYTPEELHDALGEIYAFIFLHVEASKVMVLETKVKGHIAKLLRLIKGGLRGTVGSRLTIPRVIGSVSSTFSKSKKHEYHDIVKRLYELGHSTDQLANTILALMVTSSVELVLAATNTLNFYLGTNHLEKLSALVNADKNAQLDGYIYEALRLDPTFQGVFRISNKEQTVNGQTFKKDDRIFLDVGSANRDSAVFTNATGIDVERSTKDRLYADGIFNYLGEGLTLKIVSQILRGILEFKNIRRAPGQSGVLQRYKHSSRPELSYAYLDKDQAPSAWPTSMSIQYDCK